MDNNLNQVQPLNEDDDVVLLSSDDDEDDLLLISSDDITGSDGLLLLESEENSLLLEESNNYSVEQVSSSIFFFNDAINSKDDINSFANFFGSDFDSGLVVEEDSEFLEDTEDEHIPFQDDFMFDEKDEISIEKGVLLLDALPQNSVFQLCLTMSVKEICSVYDENGNQVEKEFLRYKYDGDITDDAKNYLLNGDGDQNQILQAETEYKNRLTSSVVSLLSGLYDEAVYTGMKDTLKVSGKSNKKASYFENSTLTNDVLDYLSQYLINQEESTADRVYRKKFAEGERGRHNTYNDVYIINNIIHYLIANNIVSSAVLDNPTKLTELQEEIFAIFDHKMYNKDTSKNYTANSVRDWFVKTNQLNKILLSLMVVYPVLCDFREAPVVLRGWEMSQMPVHIMANTDKAGYALSVVIEDKTVERGYSVQSILDFLLNNSSALSKNPEISPNIIGLTGFTLHDANDELDFNLHRLFALAKNIGRQEDERGTRFLMRCCCGEHSYYDITSNIFAFVYYPGRGDYQVQLAYIPAVCPYCGRIVLMDTLQYENLKVEIASVLNMDCTDGPRFDNGFVKQFGFKVYPPYNLIDTELASESLLKAAAPESKEYDSEVGAGSSLTVTSPYEAEDIQRHIKEYEAELTRFRNLALIQQDLGKHVLAYNVCTLLQKDYNQLKSIAISSVLTYMVHEDLLPSATLEIKDSMLLYWSDDYNSTNIKKRLLNSFDGVINEELLHRQYENELNISPKEALLSLSLDKKWVFLNQVYSRFLTGKKHKETGTEEEWYICYKELGKELQNLIMITDVEDYVKRLDKNIFNIAMVNLVNQSIDYKNYAQFLSNSMFLDFLDRASDICIMMNLSDDLVRFLLQSSKEIGILATDPNDLKKFENRLLGNVKKLSVGRNKDGDIIAKDSYYMKLFQSNYPDVNLLSFSNSNALRSRLKEQVKDIVGNSSKYINFVRCIGLYEKIHAAIETDDSVKFAECIRGNYSDNDQEALLSIENKILSREFYALYLELRNNTTISDSDLLDYVNKNCLMEFKTIGNLFRFLSSRQELITSIIMDMIKSFYEGVEFFETLFPVMLGLNIQRLRQPNRTIYDFIQVENPTLEDQCRDCALGLIYTKDDMNYMSESEERDDSGLTQLSLTEMLDKHMQYLATNYLVDLLKLMPEKYLDYLKYYRSDD